MIKIYADTCNYFRAHEDLYCEDIFEEPIDDVMETPEQAQANYEMYLKEKEGKINDKM